jgi:hypothetical protein
MLRPQFGTPLAIAVSVSSDDPRAGLFGAANGGFGIIAVVAA